MRKLKLGVDREAVMEALPAAHLSLAISSGSSFGKTDYFQVGSHHMLILGFDSDRKLVYALMKRGDKLIERIDK